MTQKVRNIKSAEVETAKTILQERIPFMVGEKTFQVPKPTPATLALVSAEVSQLDLVSEQVSMEETDKIPAMVITDGSQMDKVCRIMAIVILGAKAIRDAQPEKHRWWEFWKRGAEKSELERLTDEIMHNCSSRELEGLLSDTFSHLDLGFFFGITTSLRGLNLTKATKKTTASGQ